MPAQPAQDPITSKSLSFHLLLWSFLLILSLAWALYDEMYGLRPWRSYQKRFIEAYSSYLQREIPKQQQAEQSIRNSPEYQKLEAQWKAAEAAVAPRLSEIDGEINRINRRLGVLTPVFQEARGRVAALVYQLEVARADDRQSRLREVEQAKQQTYSLSLPGLKGDEVEPVQLSYTDLELEFNRLKDRKAALVAERAAVLAEADALRRQLESYFSEKLAGLTGQQLQGLLRAVNNLDVRIRQIHNESAGLVDRCQSCHIGMDLSLVPPNLTLTKAELNLEGNPDAPFSSHPNIELLRLHDPDRDPAKALERIGCSPCHGGNGRATSSVVKGHGRHKYWLWPLYYRENFEAGCQMCHAQDMVLDHAPVLNRGKELYRERGCVGCHRFEGFDNEAEQLLSARQRIRQLEQQKREYEQEIARLQRRADDPATPLEVARQLNERAASLPVVMSQLDAEIEQLQQRTVSLMREEKKVGPSLKEVRVKLKKEWIPYWLANTHEFRPDTKMPQFRLEEGEIQAISAFIWQMGLPGPLEKQPRGDPARGKQLFETRGCLGCHSIGEGANKIGGDFAANLSRIGEKANYDYLVRWIYNPRQRTRPYDPIAKKDLGPEDYAKHGKPFVFDLKNSRSPDGKHELVVMLPTVMPSLRLTWQEARDIASYLITLRRSDANYPPAPYLDDPNLRERGRELVKFYGCAGCHEIATLEEEGRIGTELTNEGSKPVDRLDFALLTHNAKRGILPDGSPSPRGKWYDHKGFFEQKLANPAIFDQGKYKPDPRDRLRMPKPNLTPADINALTTFLLGSVDPQVPNDLLYRPEGARKDIQDGWWIITKYNCMGCHQIRVGQRSALQDLPQYQGPNADKLPPPLFGAGARLNPRWLARFLENPALSETDIHRNGVRNYLEIRMPTFYLSDNEIRKLVRFFEALSAQERPFIPPVIQPLTEAERTMARDLFTHPAAPCLRCHATGDPAHDRNATAPNFLLAGERLRPPWTQRWLLDPARLIPGTAMPSGLFRREGERWVFAGPLPASLRNYRGDHAELLVRYMFLMTPAEQRLLISRSPRATGASTGGSE